MKTGENTSSILIWGVLSAAALAVIAAVVVSLAEQSRGNLPVIGSLPDFQLVTSDGKSFDRRQLEGRIHVIDFFFTRCQGICPVMNGNMKRMYDRYRGSDKAHFLSITVDPEYDSSEVMQQYAREFGVDDDRWMFAGGDLDSIAALMETGFFLDSSDLPSNHPTKLILVDERAQIRGYYSYNDEVELELLQQHIRQLARAL